MNWYWSTFFPGWSSFMNATNFSVIASWGVPLNYHILIHIIHMKNPTRCNSVSKFYFIFVWSSTCFGRHTAHHQEPKTALVASGFTYVEVCWPCRCWTASSNYTIILWCTYPWTSGITSWSLCWGGLISSLAFVWFHCKKVVFLLSP